MKASPLQIVRYLVTDIACTVNPNFNTEKPLEASFEQFSVDVKISTVQPTEEAPGHSWWVEMQIVQRIKENQNFPYNFRITLAGMFSVQEGSSLGGNESQFVQVNGSSMLYGIAREHIRALTAAGPWFAILLPTMSFYDKAPGEAAAQV